VPEMLAAVRATKQLYFDSVSNVIVDERERWFNVPAPRFYARTALSEATSVGGLAPLTQSETRPIQMSG
jgi:hypothetical protein